MKKIKKFTFYIVLFSIVLGACGRKDEEDAERLIEMSQQVESLYNEDQNDLAEDISVEKLEEAEEKLQAEKEKELNEENQETLEDIKGLYMNAYDMYELEKDIHELFTDEILVEAIEFKDVEVLSTRLSEINQEKWTNYVPRQEAKLAEADGQLENIKQAKESVANLYQDDGQVTGEASREDESATQEAVAKVKNETIRADLEKQLTKVAEILTEREVAEEAARKEAEKAVKSIGRFAGYYHNSQYNDLITITEDRYEGFVPHSDVFFDYEIVEIIHNSGDEITLILHHDAYNEGGYSVPEITAKEVWKLVDGGNYLQTETAILRRVTSEEFEKLKNPFDFN